MISCTFSNLQIFKLAGIFPFSDDLVNKSCQYHQQQRQTDIDELPGGFLVFYTGRVEKTKHNFLITCFYNTWLIGKIFQTVHKEAVVCKRNKESCIIGLLHIFFISLAVPS